MHSRVAFYRLRSGSIDQVVDEVKSEHGLMSIFSAQPGFRAYELIEAGSGLISVSHWDSVDQAQAADRAAASWVADHIDELVTLRQSDTGTVVLSAAADAVTA